MAETTSKKPRATAVKKTTTVAKTSTTRKKITSNPLTSSFNTVRQQTLKHWERLKSIPPRTQLAIAGVVAVVLIAVLFKNLFVVAIVNGQPITRLELVRNLEQKSGEKELEELITKTLVFQEARKENVTVGDEEVDTEVKRLEEEITASGQNFEELLASRELTREKLKENLKLNRLASKIVEKNITVSDEEVKAYMEENKDSLPKDKSEEEIKKDVSEQLKAEKTEKAISEFVSRIRSQAKINYFIAY
jgi:hypothetical protein